MNYRNDVIRNFAEQDALVREMKRKDSKSQEDKNPSFTSLGNLIQLIKRVDLLSSLEVLSYSLLMFSKLSDTLMFLIMITVIA